ncbi:IclR family transcriptional regulator [Propionibacterium sp.]|uniref:IclR family transcriptional regulator n=1 Tax=Propionibacterium sp. TaxID=1977903 RepID=UPI0039EB5E31
MTVTDPSAQTGTSSPAPAVSRAVMILSTLAEGRGTELSLADLARAIGAPKSSAFNICVVLEQAQLISKREYGYVLGRRNVELGGAYLTGFDQVREFYRACSSSPALREELVHLAVLDGTDVVYLARHEGAAPLRLSAGVGDRFPASITAVGNALLMALDPHDVEARYAAVGDFPSYTSHSTKTFEELQAKLEASRERGYSLDRSETFPNVNGIAMPVPARHPGENALAIGVSFIGSTDDFQVPEERMMRVAEALREAVRQLTNPMSRDALMAP